MASEASPVTWSLIGAGSAASISVSSRIVSRSPPARRALTVADCGASGVPKAARAFTVRSLVHAPVSATFPVSDPSAFAPEASPFTSRRETVRTFCFQAARACRVSRRFPDASTSAIVSSSSATSTGGRTSGSAGNRGFEKSAVRRSPRGWADGSVGVWAGASAMLADALPCEAPSGASVFSGAADFVSLAGAAVSCGCACSSSASLTSEAARTAAATAVGADSVVPAEVGAGAVFPSAVSGIETRTPVSAAFVIVTSRSNQRPATWKSRQAIFVSSTSTETSATVRLLRKKGSGARSSVSGVEGSVVVSAEGGRSFVRTTTSAPVRRTSSTTIRFEKTARPVTS